MTTPRWLAAVPAARRKTAVLAFLLLVAVSSPSTAVSHWRSLGPHRGNLIEVAGLAFDPSRPGRAFAVLATGGIARSDDGGRTWRVMSDGINGPAVGSITVHPRLGRLVYAVGAHLFRSLDAGRTWTPLPLNGVYSVAPDPRDPAVVWAGTSHGLFRSGDTGQTWKRIQANLPRSYAVGLLAVDHLDPQRLYIGVFDSSGYNYDLWTSGNGGRSWGLRRTDRSRVYWIYTDLHAAQTVYIGGSSRILRSRDAGQTWEAFLDIASDPVVGVMAGDPQDASIFFAFLYNQSDLTRDLYRTTDAGRHWRRLTRGLPGLREARAVVAGGDGTVLLAGREQSDKFVVLRSADSGDSWDLVERGPSFLRVDAVTVTGSGALLAGISEDGVERSLDGGATWTTTLPLFPYPTCLVRDPHDPETVYACTNYPYNPDVGILWKTVDGGASWIPLPLPFAGEVVDAQDLAVDPADPQTLYLVAGGGLFRSRDGGQTWERIGGPDNTYESVAVQAGTPGTILAHGLVGVYRSTDHGDTWTQVLAREGDSYVTYADFSPADPNVVYAVSGTTLFRSDDAGATFASIGELLQGGPIVLDPLDPDTIVFSSAQGALMRLTLGQGPEVLPGGATHNYVQSLAFDPNDPLRLFVGTGDLGLMEYRFEASPTP